ncbi:MAG: alginate lyase family protein [Muribaculaceae bacterium]|nr:alginate lyase family protein [Muribaculaceae bacterium]
MKKFFSIILSAATILGAASCSEIEDGWSDIDSWEIPAPTYAPKVYTFDHPCMLHTAADIEYTKQHLGQQPWADAYRKLLTSGYCNVNHQPHPEKYLARLDATNWGDGGGRWDDAGLRDEYYPGIHNNYTNFFRDCAAAYQLALQWQLGGDAACAQAAINILTQWAEVNKGLLLGRDKWKDDVIDSNEYLIMFQIHQAANAAELVRDYNNWESTESFGKVVNWLTTYFYPFCSKFIAMNKDDHWWMNWDLASMTAILSIGILADDNDMVNEAILHFKQGEGPGCIMRKGVIDVFDDPDGSGEKLAQGNEAGRDQGHNTLCAAMVGTFCQMALGIGEDLFSFEDGRAIAFAQYVAKYNIVIPELGTDYKTEGLTDASFKYRESSMPFKEYSYNGGLMTGISGAGRGTIRPGWDIWAGYCKSHGVKATYVTEIANHFRPDGGGGHYGGNSGGFDQLGFSTLMHHRE